MGTSRNGADMARKLRAAAKAIEKQRKDALNDLESDMEDAFNAAVRNDLNVTGTPQGFRNWVQQLEAQAKQAGPDLIRFAPVGKSIGPITLAEFGREYGAASDLILVGRVRKKSGTRRAKSRGRNQSATEGKQTWTDATEKIVEVLPPKLATDFTKAMREVFLR